MPYFNERQISEIISDLAVLRPRGQMVWRAILRRVNEKGDTPSSVITNSYASTDSGVVHAGYSRISRAACSPAVSRSTS